MGAVSRALGMGSTIEFEGKLYQIAPWSYKIQGAFEQWAERQAWGTARRATKSLPADEAREVYATVSRDITAGTYSFGSETVARMLQNLPALKHLILLLLQESNDDVTPELIERMVKHDMETIMAKVNEATADPNLPAPTGTTNSPATV